MRSDLPGQALGSRPAIPQIDTIRVVAMLGVFLHHLWNGVIPTPSGSVQKILDAVFDAGADGVVFFNLISGFLLALPYLGPRPRPFEGFGQFLRKRLLRIVPPYYVALVLFSAGNILVFGVPLPSALSTLLQHILFLNSLSYPMLMTNFSAFWYLGMLAQFYLVFPFVLRFFMRLGSARATLWICACCWAGSGILALFQSAYPDSSVGMLRYMMQFNLPVRLPEFAIGMWLTSAWNPSEVPLGRGVLDRSLWVFLGALLAYAVLGAPFAPKLDLPLLHMYHVAACVLLFLFLFFWSPVAAAGRSGLVRRLSVHSYGIYIVHQPLFSYAGVLPGSVAGGPGKFLELVILLLPLSFVVAWAVNWLAASLLERGAGGGKYLRVPGLRQTQNPVNPTDRDP